MQAQLGPFFRRLILPLIFTFTTIAVIETAIQLVFRRNCSTLAWVPFQKLLDLVTGASILKAG